jgi:hypothetical protein
VENFRSASESLRRRIWINGHQIGQINALQRRQGFFVLKDDPVTPELPALMLAFPERFGAKAEMREALEPGVWVGGDALRSLITSALEPGELLFYDFGIHCLDPLPQPQVLQLPCLAIGGIVVAMSMPHPPKNQQGDDIQLGHKPGTWGKLLPGFYLIDGRAAGPAAPQGGLVLPAGAFLDAEGFLSAHAQA